MMFDRDLEDVPYDDENLPDSKLPLMTLHTMRNTQSFKYPSFPQGGDSFSEALDMSLDRDIYINNAKMVREAAFQYLKNCIKEYNRDEKVFHQSSIFRFPSEAAPAHHEDNTFHSLIHGNHLLTESHKRELLKNFQEYEEFLGVFNELKDQFGKEICQELLYVVASLLEVKMKYYRSLVNRENDTFLPKVERFWGYENEEEIFKGSWQVYEEIDYDQIKKFGSLGVEDIAMKIYFSGKLKFLTLREIKGELKEGVSVADKFAILIAHFSRNLFLSLSGMAQKSEEACELASEFSLNYIEETDSVVETLNKKVKSDQ